MKRDLSKCWNFRAGLTGAIDDALVTSYGIYAAPGRELGGSDRLVVTVWDHLLEETN